MRTNESALVIVSINSNIVIESALSIYYITDYTLCVASLIYINP